ERSLHPAAVATFDAGLLDRLIDEMEAEGIKDLLGEGIEPVGVEYSLELEVSTKGGPPVMLQCPDAVRRSHDQLHLFLKSRLAAGPDGLSLDIARLRVRTAMPKPELVEMPLQAADSSTALKGSRKVAWGTERGEARIYSWERLRAGNRVEGCA